VRQAAVEGTQEGAVLLAEEYRMNALIGAYPKPFIALVHGICMGGGAGVSVHGRYRLADASLVFAMPETGIGFVPDVGSSYFLSKLRDQMGLYLGLTGQSVTLADALDLGLMTHWVAQQDFEPVIAALAQGQDVQKAIAPFLRKTEPGRLSAHRRRIATVFSASSVEAILERLDREGSEFALETARLLRSRSPTSLKLVLRQLRQARGLSLNQCLAMEYRLALRLLVTHDFREGVRAALLDKDRNPQWQPASLAGVGDLDRFFAPLGDQELFQI
jgi:enoyl-CoA hydratase